jgi:hypothetical protein
MLQRRNGRKPNGLGGVVAATLTAGWRDGKLPSKPLIPRLSTMTTLDTRGALRRTARFAIAGAAILGAVQGASADDAGVHDFFSAIFGGGAGSAGNGEEARTNSAPAASPTVDGPIERHHSFRSRPLTVRLHRAPKDASPKLVVSRDVPAKPGKVSIFEDKTLRRGDAVMTSKGIRIFAGSNSWPYVPQDFVSLAEADHMSQDTSKVLAQLDRAPRG